MTSRARISDGIEFSVISAAGRRRYSMPMTERPVESLGGLPADMLQGARLIVDPAQMLPEELCFEAAETPKPKDGKR